LPIRAGLAIPPALSALQEIFGGLGVALARAFRIINPDV
jgi:hypothetical protein